MYKSVFAIVSLWFVISVNTAAAHDSRVPYATQLTDGEIAYIYLQANQFDVEEAKPRHRPWHGTRSQAAWRDGGEGSQRGHYGVRGNFDGARHQTNGPFRQRDD